MERKFTGSRYDSALSTTEIAKKVREWVKKTYPFWKFSVRSEYYSMGSSIQVTLMEAPIEIYSKPNSTDNWSSFSGNNNNNMFTEEAFKVMNDVIDYVESYNYDNSDPMTDYYCVKFGFYSINIGQWDKPFKVVEPKAKTKKVKPIQEQQCKEFEEFEDGSISIIEYSDKSFVVVGDTKPIKEVLKGLGGRFNSKLSCGCGWVFPIKQRELVSSVFGIQI